MSRRLEPRAVLRDQDESRNGQGPSQADLGKRSITRRDGGCGSPKDRGIMGSISKKSELHFEFDSTPRSFTAVEKLGVLKAVDAFTEMGELNELLQNEGVSASTFFEWRLERDRDELADRAS